MTPGRIHRTEPITEHPPSQCARQPATTGRLRRRLFFTLAFTALLWAPAGLAGTTIKIASIAPDGTVWMQKMRAGAEEIAKRTDARVQLKFYPGGIMGSDKAVMRKVRLGQLHGGAVTSSAVAEIYPDMQVYGLPLLFRSFEEVDHVRKRMDAELVKGMEEHGFISFGFAEGGFAYLMSNARIASVSELKGQRVWLPEDDRYTQAWFEAAGVTPVQLPITDVLTGLQTGLLSTVGTSAIGAIALQWHTKVKYLTDVPLLYLTGTLLVDKRIFARLTPEDQAVLREVMRDVYAELDRLNRSDEAGAMKALRSQGLEFVAVSAPARREMEKTAQTAREQLTRQDLVGVDVLTKIDGLLNELRGARQ
jgi:TRAP-type C4-dicarboxylate transport system substrate-binding protein